MLKFVDESDIMYISKLLGAFVLTSLKIIKFIKKNILAFAFSGLIVLFVSVIYITHDVIYSKNESYSSNTSSTAVTTVNTNVNKIINTAKTKPKTNNYNTKESSSKKSKSKTTTITSIKTSKTRKTTEKEIINFPIDINTATVEELMQIKNIGAVTANKIIEYRNSLGVISNFDLLLNVNGIGEATLNNLKQYLYISDDVYQEMTQSTTTAPADTKTRRITTTTHRKYQSVNINKASAKEISDSLLIDMRLAREIIDLRNKISYFSNLNELFYIDDFPKAIYDTRKDYILM